MIKTAKKYPHHPTIGHLFKGFSSLTWKTETYHCDSWDSEIGFWMTNVNNVEDRKNVSERAIGATFHHDYDHCTHKNCQISE